MRPWACSMGVLVALTDTTGIAEEQTNGAAELAALLQDPLANIAALVTDNTLGLRGGPDNDESYEINLQPVYSLNLEELGLSVIPRALIPIIGSKPGGDLPRLTFDDDDELALDGGRDKGREWGLSDITTQFFITPMGQEGVKLGAGPMFSFNTRTDTDVKGPGFGAGPVGVLVADIGQVSIATIAGHLQGFDNDFSTTFVQPMLYYNFEELPGAFLAYNNTLSYDHKTQGPGRGNSWTVPLGLTGGKAFDMGGGHGFELGLGFYHLPSWGRPAGGSEYEVKLGLAWLFPR